jgi:excinuclease ABC subunit B
VVKYMDSEALDKAIEKTRKQMEKAAKELDFIEAARFRDEMFALQQLARDRKASRK